MAIYLVGRVLGGLITLFCVSALAFFATALAPGNPAAVLLGNLATPERIAVVTHEMGLDKPLPVRYGIWLQQTLKGNLGTSNLSFKPVNELLAAALPPTLELAILSLALAIVIAIPMGLLLAEKRDRWWARPIAGLITLGISVPGFWVGLLLIILFSVTFKLLPSGGYVSISRSPTGNLRAMILPVLTLAIYLIPSLVRFVRVTAANVLREDYIDTARAKGVGNARILLQHVAPNTLITTVTYIGLQLGVLISGAIIVEIIFSIPGLGRLGMNAVLNRDYPVIQGVVLLAATGYVVVNLAIDLVYSLIDPRIRTR
ncbi:ABC transporter permease [Mesorhizobium sp. BAC0120]|uniref:ABC transporter permease n=1 Tax=Mesorhizobium sp. BAC0120 TaxID=3090670 RepID=UPI00298CFD6A|nr:ABC transporter permease [Mesorhizobium sp. BAC0120]MDW6023567.1 ABC transporter permease [Mesorhizobium sp. BAC0120]